MYEFIIQYSDDLKYRLIGSLSYKLLDKEMETIFTVNKKDIFDMKSNYYLESYSYITRVLEWSINEYLETIPREYRFFDKIEIYKKTIEF